MVKKLSYQNGFGSYFQTEALDNALPRNQNSPQQPPYGLFAEQINGTAFTNPRHCNLKTWLYRIRPSVVHSGEFSLVNQKHIVSAPITDIHTPPTQMRWNPPTIPNKPTDFLQGLLTMAAHGNVKTQNGAAIHLYSINKSMDNTYFCNSDGDLLIVPQQGEILFKTELGNIEIKPKEIAIIPRGIRFQVIVESPHAIGYICENYGNHFTLPERGPIGSNGLADERHFQAPVSTFEDLSGDFILYNKFQGHLWQTHIPHSPLDVVAWHGNYTPYKYDLSLFSPVWSVNFDHSDPSIFTVLTSASHQPGTADVDFVIFPERWMTTEHSFRPPYFHRNIMSEYMGLICGEYDAKKSDFVPGGSSLHNCMSGHGPDADIFEQASQQQLQPYRYQNTLAFMFESQYTWQLSEFALNGPLRQADYLQCWKNLKSAFNNKKSHSLLD